MRPGSTYRVQLHAGFGFDDAAELADYIAELGVTHLYCSPYLQAAPGSTHGYDVVDPQRLDSERGGAPGHARMVGALRDAGLGQVLDIVPNHMAADRANRWWWDVLENGPASLYTRYFDIDWQGSDDRSAFTVLVPVLGDHYGRVLEAGELCLARVGGAFVIRYHDHELPVSPATFDETLSAAARRAGSADLATVAEAFAALPAVRVADDPVVPERHARQVELGAELAALCEADPDVAAAIDVDVAAVNADVDRLDALLRRQNYRLALWRTASEELDYRRFFNIETLIGVRVEDPDVFAETHALVLELVRDGTLDGLRIDHVDGLRDPEHYLDVLSEATGGRYTVVEKILEPTESLPDTWQVAGTSGYDFLTRVNNLFVETANEQALTDCYAAFTGEPPSYTEVAHHAKHQIMHDELAAEVERLTALLAVLCDDHRRHRDHTRRELRHALRELVANFSTYRTYVQPGSPASPADRGHVIAAVAAAVQRAPDIDPELLEFLGHLAIGTHDGALETEFAQRLQQLTGPVMAKGVEDTAFYRYHRLLSLNEVGGDPGIFGRPVADFHADTAATASRWPHAMLTLSTHDTKRSADVRARLNVLSEVPGAWRDTVDRWGEGNNRHRNDGWPDRNAEYLLYQTLVGAWPVTIDRVVAFMTKATREAKVHTSWIEPNAGYDDAVTSFVKAVMTDDAFLAGLDDFLREHRIVERGRRNSLAQTALLLTCPGVPDLYQGSELWDLSLVDPDNRRPVDYDLRRRLLAELTAEPSGEQSGEQSGELSGGPPTDAPPVRAADWHPDAGGPKLLLVRRLLAHWRAHPDLHDSPAYEPLETHGPRAGAVVAYDRGGLAVVAPVRTPTAPRWWSDTTVGLPAGTWTDVVTGETVDGGVRRLDQLLAGFPVAVLARRTA
jgi:(1->4)-alpha-D-glucan 1-alpha-D-glucosylmutase